MTREEAINILNRDDNSMRKGYFCINDFMAIEVLKSQEPCEDCISRSSIKQKLQEHHDFFVNAHGGFSNLPPDDKSRADEITNCIAMVVNEPPVTPQKRVGRWIYDKTIENWRCSECNETPRTMGYVGTADFMAEHFRFCNHCGTKMEVEE